MSAGGAFGGARGYQARAPEKGIFPLDHFGECKQVSILPPWLGPQALLQLLSEWACRSRRSIWPVSKNRKELLTTASRLHSNTCSAGWTGGQWSSDSSPRHHSCIFIASPKHGHHIVHATCRNLMARQEMSELGFGRSQKREAGTGGETPEERKKQGFVAGLPRKQ